MFSVIFKLYKKNWADPLFQLFRFSFSYGCSVQNFNELVLWFYRSNKNKKRKREKLTKGGIFKAHEFSAQAS